MILKKETEFAPGYTPITSIQGMHPQMLLDFGILRLREGDVWQCNAQLERAWLLIDGKVEFHWDNTSARGERHSCFDDNPVALHVARGTAVTITALQDSEICVEKVENERLFHATFYEQKDIRCDVFGAGVLGEASMRTVRTVFDGESSLDSNMVLGEVINHPGKWSSYPPHDHPHPEIYHYRFFPRQGFGISLLDDDAYKVGDGDTSLILPNTTHSQVAGAGYAMYYIWMIPHLPNDRWLPSTRYYRKEHAWMLEPDVSIWPERTYKRGE